MEVLVLSFLVHRFLVLSILGPRLQILTILIPSILGPRLLVLMISVFGFLFPRLLVFNLLVLVFGILFFSHTLSVDDNHLSVILFMLSAWLEGVLYCLKSFIHSQGLAHTRQSPPQGTFPWSTFIRIKDFPNTTATSSIRPPALPSLGSRSISFFYNHTMLRWWVLYPKFIIMNFPRPDIAFLSLQPSSVQINKDLGEFELIELIWTISMYISSILLLAQAARKGRIILIVPFILPAESKRAHLNVSSVLRICSQLTQAPWTLCLHPWCLLNVWTSWGCADGGAHHSHK